MRSTAFDKITVVYRHIDENGHSVSKRNVPKMAITDKMVKNSCLSVNLSEILADCPKNKKYVPSQHVFLSLFSCVRGHKRSASHLVFNRVQTSNKAHDKFVPRRDCACADHSRPSLSTALLGGWSSHLVNRVSPHNPLVPSSLARARQAYPSQARLGYAGAERSAPHLHNQVPARIPPIASKDSLDEASSPSVVQCLRTGSYPLASAPCSKKRIIKLSFNRRKILCKNKSFLRFPKSEK